MKSRILIINHSFPYSGEEFLKNELSWASDNFEITIFPIHLKNISDRQSVVNESFDVFTVASNLTIVDHLISIVSSFHSFFENHELHAAFSRKQPLRNMLKAFKFTYFSESRARVIGKWIKKNYYNEPIVFYSYWMYEAAYIAIRLHEMYPNSKVITRCHGYDLYEDRHINGYIPYRNYIMNSLDKIYTVSEDGKSYINQKYNSRWNHKTEIMRLGSVNCGECSAKKGAKLSVLSCSNLVEVKRVHKIIEALSLTKRQICWYHIGDGPLRNDLEIMARELPKNIEWHFLGQIPNSSLMQFYQDNYIDTFINVSESEGVPVSIMEALSFGIPVIATDVGGTKEIIFNQKNGILLDKNFEPKQLLDSIESITKINTNTYFRSNAKAIWSNSCDAETNYQIFYEELSKLED